MAQCRYDRFCFGEKERKIPLRETMQKTINYWSDRKIAKIIECIRRNTNSMWIFAILELRLYHRWMMEITNQLLEMYFNVCLVWFYSGYPPLQENWIWIVHRWHKDSVCCRLFNAHTKDSTTRKDKTKQKIDWILAIRPHSCNICPHFRLLCMHLHPIFLFFSANLSHFQFSDLFPSGWIFSIPC